jgi:hypothetical protein
MRCSVKVASQFLSFWYLREIARRTWVVSASKVEGLVVTMGFFEGAEAAMDTAQHPTSAGNIRANFLKITPAFYAI